MSKPSITWIDPHIHFFALNEGHYGWLKPANAPFWPDKKAIAKHTTEHMLYCASLGQLGGFVHIEAGFDNERPWREIDFSNAPLLTAFSFYCEYRFNLYARWQPH